MQVVVRAVIGVSLAVLFGLIAVPALAAEDVQTLRFISTRSSQQSVDVGAAGASTGDLRFTGHTLRRAEADADRPTGAQIGTQSTASTVLSRGSVDLVSTSVLPAGSITAGGVVRGVARTFAVLGGTGAYANVRGTLTVKPLDASSLRARVHALHGEPRRARARRAAGTGRPRRSCGSDRRGRRHRSDRRHRSRRRDGAGRRGRCCRPRRPARLAGAAGDAWR